MNGNSGFLASMALFRQLYNDRSNIFQVVAYFLVDMIKDERMKSFTLPQIANLINSNYSFDIPESIYRRSLKNLTRSKILSLNDSVYNLVGDINSLKSPDIDEMADDVKKDHKFIIESLYSFVESKLKAELSIDDKKEVMKSFIDYFTNENSKGKYSDYISGFVISIKSNPEYLSKLNTIKEGIIIYSGISYGIENDSITKLNSVLTIFLDQEILFSISGFNGDIYSNIASDIIKFANEINNKTLRARGKAFIELRFLEETRRSVKNFFSATEHSLRNNTVLDPDAIAMRIILENCESPADVKQKEINFFKGLEDLGIFVEDEIEYYSAENMIYNSISAELCQAISKDLNIKEDDIAFEVLNMISIRRKANMSQSLFESKYVLLTENSNRHRIARSELISSSKNFPLTINTDLFVIHAWLMLNKGFSLNEHPASFDVVLKAQITLSSRLSKNVRYDYDKLKIAFDNGEMSREEATQNIVHLRNLAVLPEQISENNLNDIFEGISNSEIASAKEIMDRKDIEIKKAKEELVRLSKVTNEYEKRAEIKINSQEEKILELSSKLDEVSRKLLENDHAKKVEESNKTRKKKKRELIIQVIAVVILSGVIAYFIVTNSLVNYMAASFGVIVTLFIGVTSIFKLISTYYKKYSNLSNSEEI